VSSALYLYMRQMNINVNAVCKLVTKASEKCVYSWSTSFLSSSLSRPFSVSEGGLWVIFFICGLFSSFEIAQNIRLSSKTGWWYF